MDIDRSSTFATSAQLWRFHVGAGTAHCGECTADLSAQDPWHLGFNPVGEMGSGPKPSKISYTNAASVSQKDWCRWGLSTAPTLQSLSKVAPDCISSIRLLKKAG